jgi:hypothetical protein
MRVKTNAFELDDECRDKILEMAADGMTPSKITQVVHHCHTLVSEVIREAALEGDLPVVVRRRVLMSLPITPVGKEREKCPVCRAWDCFLTESGICCACELRRRIS